MLQRGSITVLGCLLLIGLLLGGAGTAAHAQSSEEATYTVVLRDVPLDQALRTVADSTHANLIYDSHLVQDVRVYCVVRDAPAEDLLRCILAETELDYFRTSSGTYVLTEATRERPRFGRLAGIVVDSETGEPLPYANVLLTDAGVGTAANEGGLFSFSSLRPGPYQLVVTYVGYETKVDSVWIAPGGREQEQVALETRTVAARPIVVDGLQQRLPSRSLGQGVLEEEELAEGWNGSGSADVARQASSLLGVALQEPLADLHVQGGAAGELQVELDGVPVRSPVTLGQLLGAFSPLALERITLHKAGFGAAQGSHLSGSIAAEHALAGEHYATLQADPLSMNARAQGRWDRTGGLQGSALAALRTSLWSVYPDPSLRQLLRDWHVTDALLVPENRGGAPSAELSRHQADVAFSDMHLAARLRPGPFQTLHASLYRGHNEVWSEATPATGEPSPEALSHTRDSYHWTSWGSQVRYEGLLGARLMSSLALSHSWQSVGHGYRMEEAAEAPGNAYASVQPDPYDGNRIGETALKAGLDYHVAGRHQLSGALELTRTQSRTLVNNDFFRSLTYELARWRLAGFVQDEVSLGLRTQLEAGTRMTYVPARQTVYFEPRLALRYDGEHARAGDYALRLAGGVYRQFVNQFDLSSTGPTAILPSIRFWLPVDHSVAPPRSYHLAADVLLRPASSWQINLEAYHKWQPHLLEVDYPALLEDDAAPEEAVSQAEFIAPSRGQAYGADVRVRYDGAWLESAVSYSYSRSLRRFPGRFQEEMQPTPWDQPHRLTLDQRVALSSTTAAQVRWRSIWGRSWAFRRAYYDYLAPQATPDDFAPFDLNQPAQQRLSPLHQLDLGLVYERTWSGFSVRLRAELINALDRRNAFDWRLQEGADGYERTARTLPGRRPVLSLQVSY